MLFRSLALALLASLVTYHAVEKPIRFRWAYRHKVFLLFAAMVLVAILGRLVKQKTIHPRSASLPYVNILELRPDYPTPPGAVADPGGNFGMIGKNPKRAILLAGDSHAAQYRLTMARLGAEAMRSQPEGPRAMYSLDYFDPRTLPRLLPFILKDSSIESVVLSNFWAFVYGSNRINYAVRCCMGGVGRMVGGASYQDPPPEAELAQIDSALESSIRKLVSSGKKVFLVLDNPFGEELMPKTFIRRGLLGGVELLPKEARVAGLSKALALERTEPTRSRVSRIALRSGATLIDPVATLCASENCMIRAENGWPIYKDYDHLSPQSSEQLVRYLDFLFR